MSLEKPYSLELETFLDRLRSCKTLDDFNASLNLISDNFVKQGVTPKFLEKLFEDDRARREARGIRTIIY